MALAASSLLQAGLRRLIEIFIVLLFSLLLLMFLAAFSLVFFLRINN